MMDIAQEILGNPSEGREDDTSNNIGWGHWSKNRAKWSEKIAIFMSNHHDTIEVEKGCTIMIPIEVQNQTMWPWKRGCWFGLEKATNSDIIVSDIPVDFVVSGM